MKHFAYETETRKREIFFKEPESFNKFTDKELLSYALGAALYMPAVKDSIAKDVVEQKYPELTAMVIDLEDAVSDHLIAEAEIRLVDHIQTIFHALEEQQITIDALPLIFVRVRDPEQMRRVTTSLGSLQCVLTGYVFPKFSYETGAQYLDILQTNNTGDRVLYGMPILESSEIMYKESRMEALLNIKKLVDSYEPLILNIRIGATDFSSFYGIRRKVDSTIYEVSVIRDCITDILNLFNRQDGYVISGPVWEFFYKEQLPLISKLKVTPFQERSERTAKNKRLENMNQYIEGLINEVQLDKLNGIVGKTIIHPTHIKPVHSVYTVTHEEYMDALSILNHSEAGVLKSSYENKMNEIKPHYNWAKRILLRAKAFGVLNENQDFTRLLMEKQEEKAIHEVN
ncbi:HpcH/HpaI aldolase/citrate lyase family protein [Pullulanibacillus sp. KACC 23026]|uniref:HpcH/HpaI aldolase/citrate lyase family protein n=1 Tax=Pullulanibacillus sp. KACC 23026 TaxID=3028315 RepID=UPI0023B0FA02|nr:HpcH/HpaI aldolase/citrate lyase family protein [Pullulanibacillus sp. KACC 23026]WEG14620.1 HpcH/HpaI aldolase/citrate lyase family protein [Pullulanibacillus sp. KACC 23026]